jgi:hypothetical protein
LVRFVHANYPPSEELMAFCALVGPVEDESEAFQLFRTDVLAILSGCVHGGDTALMDAAIDALSHFDMDSVKALLPLEAKPMLETIATHPLPAFSKLLTTMMQAEVDVMTRGAFIGSGSTHSKMERQDASKDHFKATNEAAKLLLDYCQTVPHALQSTEKIHPVLMLLFVDDSIGKDMVHMQQVVSRGIDDMPNDLFTRLFTLRVWGVFYQRWMRMLSHTVDNPDREKVLINQVENYLLDKFQHEHVPSLCGHTATSLAALAMTLLEIKHPLAKTTSLTIYGRILAYIQHTGSNHVAATTVQALATLVSHMLPNEERSGQVWHVVREFILTKNAECQLGGMLGLAELIVHLDTFKSSSSTFEDLYNEVWTFFTAFEGANGLVRLTQEGQFGYFYCMSVFGTHFDHLQSAFFDKSVSVIQDVLDQAAATGEVAFPAAAAGGALLAATMVPYFGDYSHELVDMLKDLAHLSTGNVIWKTFEPIACYAYGYVQHFIAMMEPSEASSAMHGDAIQQNLQRERNEVELGALLGLNLPIHQHIYPYFTSHEHVQRIVEFVQAGLLGQTTLATQMVAGVLGSYLRVEKVATDIIGTAEPMHYSRFGAKSSWWRNVFEALHHQGDPEMLAILLQAILASTAPPPVVNWRPSLRTLLTSSGRGIQQLVLRVCSRFSSYSYSMADVFIDAIHTRKTGYVELLRLVVGPVGVGQFLSLCGFQPASTEHPVVPKRGIKHLPHPITKNQCMEVVGDMARWVSCHESLELQASLYLLCNDVVDVVLGDGDACRAAPLAAGNRADATRIDPDDRRIVAHASLQTQGHCPLGSSVCTIHGRVPTPLCAPR